MNVALTATTQRALLGDSILCWLFNGLQRRARGGVPPWPEVRAYLESCTAQGLRAGLAVPSGAAVRLVAGEFRAPSPLPCEYERNNHMRLDIQLGPRGWRSPAVFLLHGLMSTSARGYRRWMARLVEQGHTAIFVHLPYHYDRCPEDQISGEMAFSANMQRSIEGLRQAVVELRLAVADLAARGCPAQIVWGNSYGALVGAWLTVSEPLLSRAWLLEPIADLQHAVWESPVSRTIRDQLLASGATRAEFDQYLTQICPRRQVPAIAPERILLMAGGQDAVAPPAVVRAVAESWSGARYLQANQGHVGYALMRECWAVAQREGWLAEHL